MDFDKYKNRLDYKSDPRGWRQEEGRLMALFKADLEDEYDVADNPKRDQLYDIAWSLGHACGLAEVENHYAELAELIR